MVEIEYPDLAQRQSGLLIPDKKQLVKSLTNEDVAEMFGADFIELIQNRTKELGISERLSIFNSPVPHDGSQAVYLAEQFIEDDLILVSVLPKGMVTSQHHHVEPMRREIYYHVAGASNVHVGIDDKRPLPLNYIYPVREISLGLIHQVRAPESPALTLIRMENARLVPPDRLHIKHAN